MPIIELYAIINSFSLTCSVGEVVSADINWTGHGAPTQFGTLMTVYLGSDGCVELKRSSSQAIIATVGTADVNPERRRFSFAQDVSGELITGDLVDIRHKNEKVF